MIEDKEVKKDRLFMVKFLDVGGGLCTGLFDLALLHGVSEVSMENSPQTSKGFLLHLENAKKIVSIPFFY